MSDIKSKTKVHYIEKRDYGYLLFLYFAVMVIRYAMLVLFYPLLANMGFGTNWRDCVVMGWGGLRGAVGLALALVVARDSDIEKDASIKILFHVSGIAALTLFVNACTCKPLVESLGLTKRHQLKQEMLEHLAHTMEVKLKWNYNMLALTSRFRWQKPKLMGKLIHRLSLGDQTQEESNARQALEEEKAALKIQAHRRMQLQRRKQCATGSVQSNAAV